MSYILDALRRSEQERAPVDGLSIGRHDPGPGLLPPRRAMAYAAPIVGALALVGGVYLLWAQPFLNRSPAATDAPSADSASIAAIAQEPVTAPPPPAAAPTFKPVPTPGASTAAPKPTPVRDLVEQTRISRPAQSLVTEPPARRVAAVQAPAALPPAVDNVPFLRSLGPELRQALPEMVVNIHVYAASAAERILYINNRPYQAGDKLRDDIVVEEIVADGAVLSYRGQRFKLPRPS